MYKAVYIRTACCTVNVPHYDVYRVVRGQPENLTCIPGVTRKQIDMILKGLNGGK